MSEEDKDVEIRTCSDCGNDKFYKVRKQPDDGWVHDGVKCTKCGNYDWLHKFFYP